MKKHYCVAHDLWQAFRSQEKYHAVSDILWLLQLVLMPIVSRSGDFF